MKLTYKIRLFLWFFFILVIFAVGIIILQQREEKKYRTEALESNLNSYTEIIHNYINKNNLLADSIFVIDKLLNVLPVDMRVTIIEEDGSVIFDNDGDIASIAQLGNHLDRPEIRRAFYNHAGSNIRKSASTEREYLYYAKYYGNYFVRVALPYTVKVESVLRPDRGFIYIVLAMFIIGIILLNYVAGRFGKSISELKKFTTDINTGDHTSHSFKFPDDELGEIGKHLTEIFRQKEENEQKLRQEREKLIQHFQFSQNGLCIFKADYTKVYSNTRFMQYLNIITDKLVTDTDIIFTDKIFEPVQEFLRIYRKREKESNFTTKIVREGRTFEIQVIVFQDNSFEIGIKDITVTEQTRQLKQEMTNNIAHELRTPVTSLRGYLETLNEQNLPEEKQHQFIQRAYTQSIRLSNIVEDVGLISKMEEASEQFRLENTNISQVISDVRIDLIDKLEKNNIRLHVSAKDNIKVLGNYTLLYSIFRNLIDNSIEHAGNNIDIYINNYMEDDNFLYFSYYDTGKGIEERHLPRLFERFYRADEGRTRDSGGSGLGLSIVKNAINFHHGEIQVKNRKDAGLEFLFTLEK